MSYTLTIVGHKDSLTAEEGQAGEQAIIDAAKKFVAGLDGVVTAQGSFQYHGGVNLLDDNAPASTSGAAA